MRESMTLMLLVCCLAAGTTVANIAFKTPSSHRQLFLNLWRSVFVAGAAMVSSNAQATLGHALSNSSTLTNMLLQV